MRHYDLTNHLPFRYGLAALKEVPLDTVAAQFKNNAVLAAVLAADKRGVGEGALSEVLANHFGGVLTLAQNSGQDPVLFSAIKRATGSIYLDPFFASWLKGREVMRKDRTYLAEHHIYGSSRLGMQKYLPSALSFENIVPSGTMAYQSLIKAKPWYSRYGGDLFLPTVYSSDTLGTAQMGTTGLGVTTHILGMRHYELANHLGNVQATVLDRTTPVLTGVNKQLTGYRSDISGAQDYYPFGMLERRGNPATAGLMPGRYISDTATRCVTLNSTVMVKKSIREVVMVTERTIRTFMLGTVPPPPSVGSLPLEADFASEVFYHYHYRSAAFHPGGWVARATTAPGGSGLIYEVDLSGEPSGVSSYLHVHMDTSVSVQRFGFGMEVPPDVIAEVRVRQYQDDSTQKYSELVGWTKVDNLGATLLLAVDKQAIQAGGKTLAEWKLSSWDGKKFGSGISIKVAEPWTERMVWVADNRVITMCDDKDNYRFGFNGQEKVNEIAGIGNHTTALFWEYDTRIARRWNLDPVPQIGISDYAVNGLNPIWASDPLGNFDTRREARAYKKSHDISGKITKGADGLYSIDDKKNKATYTRDRSLDDMPNLLGRGEDGVIRSVMASAERPASNSNCYTCWLSDDKNSDAFRRANDLGFMPYNPEAVGGTLSVNGLYGGGGSFTLTLGISRHDGVFGSYSLGGGVGNDVSISGGMFFADYRGKGRADISTFYNGAGQQNAAGLAGISLTQWSDIQTQAGQPTTYGQNWNAIGFNVGAGTRQLPMGIISGTSQVTYGRGVSMRSIYNHFKGRK